jgi:hypothetical protein
VQPALRLHGREAFVNQPNGNGKHGRQPLCPASGESGSPAFSAVHRQGQTNDDLDCLVLVNEPAHRCERQIIRRNCVQRNRHEPTWIAPRDTDAHAPYIDRQPNTGAHAVSSRIG